MNKKVLCGIMVVCVMAGLTGCGKTKIDVTENLIVDFNGYDGYGKAVLNDDFAWLDKAEAEYEGDELLSGLKFYSDLDRAVKYTIEPSEGLKKGDEITVKVDINESAVESYNFKLSGESQKFTVSGLDKIEDFDPFADIEVVYSGMAPNASVAVKNTPNDLSLKYTWDKSNGLSNGDTVTLSVSANNGDDLEKYCLEHGKRLTATEKTYTVESLAGYVQKLEDISEDMLEKMNQQAQDKLNASIASNWAEESKLKDSKLLGYYFLVPKEGSNAWVNNYLYLVYENKVYIDKNKNDVTVGDVTYYYYTCFEDIMLLEDGTCSVNLSNSNVPNNTFKVEYKYTDKNWGWENNGNYYFYGYKDLDSMFSDCVTTKIESYIYENTVK